MAAGCAAAALRDRDAAPAAPAEADAASAWRPTAECRSRLRRLGRSPRRAEPRRPPRARPCARRASGAPTRQPASRAFSASTFAARTLVVEAVGSADVGPQRAFDRTVPREVFTQDLRTDAYVGDRVERRRGAAKGLEALQVNPGEDLRRAHGLRPG
jgi:hypothetical protein